MAFPNFHQGGFLARYTLYLTEIMLLIDRYSLWWMAGESGLGVGGGQCVRVRARIEVRVWVRVNDVDAVIMMLRSATDTPKK